MKILVAVITCAQEHYRLRAKAQRDTWAANPPEGVHVQWFVGGEHFQNEVRLPVPTDDYGSLPAKTKALCEYAIERDYDFVVKVDDDVYLDLERLKASVPTGHDYAGRVRLPSNGLPAPYCSGFCYWLSRKAMQLVVNSKDRFQTLAEDVITGNVLLRAGIHPKDDPRINIVMSKRNARTGHEGPRAGNDVIAACEFDPPGMYLTHQERLHLPSKQGFMKLPTGTPFDQIDVLMKTFLRDGLMMRCVNAIEKNMPGARIIVVDDGKHNREKRTFYAEMQLRGHVVRLLPFDAGYGAKMNEGGKLLERPYVLRIADDFNFDSAAAAGVLKLLTVHQALPDLYIASGRVNDQPYECNVTFSGSPGEMDVTLTKVDPLVTNTLLAGPMVREAIKYTTCDLTVNYSLIKSAFFKGFKWDERYKIGGDHFDLYGHSLMEGKQVVYVHGVNVNTFDALPGDIDRTYDFYRGRARLALPWTFERHGWRSFTNFDGRVDTRESVAAWAEAYDQDPPSSDPVQRRSKQVNVEKNRAYQKHLIKNRDADRAAHFGVPHVNGAPAATAPISQPGPVGKYFIHNAYLHRQSVPHFDDTKTADEWQREVYELAQEWFYSQGCESVLDIGCGNGTKLLRHFSDVSMTGTEVEPTLSWLQKQYPQYSWVEAGKTQASYDMVICSDVIEHVQDPDALLLEILRHKPRVVVLSTPARELIPGAALGPPRNKHHVREWTSEEFMKYVSGLMCNQAMVSWPMNMAAHFISNEEQCTQCMVLVRV